MQLSSHGGSELEALDIRLGDKLLPQASSGRWESVRFPTSTHSMVGFTWPQASGAPRIQIRSRIAGAWQPWRPAPHLHDLPDRDADERSDLTGTELIWIGESDGIQVRVTGTRPRDLTLVLLHPAPGLIVGDAVERTESEPRAAWDARRSFLDR